MNPFLYSLTGSTIMSLAELLAIEERPHIFQWL